MAIFILQSGPGEPREEPDLPEDAYVPGQPKLRAQMSEVVKLFAFGEPEIFAVEGARLDALMRQTKRFALLIYLASAKGGRPIRREQLLATFWPGVEEQKARNSLRQALFFIRRETGPGVLAGNRTPVVWVDRTLLRSDVAAYSQAQREGALEAALKLYRGPFLDGFHVPDAPQFGFWIEERRAHFRDTAAKAAEELARTSEAREDLPRAVRWWRRTLELRPFDQGVLRRIMTLLAESGQRDAALAELTEYQLRAQSGIGTKPSRETLDLASQISREAH
jgi:DNA-binding SARP family transcriptional activator